MKNKSAILIGIIVLLLISIIGIVIFFQEDDAESIDSSINLQKIYENTLALDNYREVLSTVYEPMDQEANVATELQREMYSKSIQNQEYILQLRNGFNLPDGFSGSEVRNFSDGNTFEIYALPGDFTNSFPGELETWISINDLEGIQPEDIEESRNEFTNMTIVNSMIDFTTLQIQNIDQESAEFIIKSENDYVDTLREVFPLMEFNGDLKLTIEFANEIINLYQITFDEGEIVYEIDQVNQQYIEENPKNITFVSF